MARAVEARAAARVAAVKAYVEVENRHTALECEATDSDREAVM